MDEDGSGNNDDRTENPLPSLEEGLDALTVVDDPNVSRNQRDDNELGSGGSRWVTNRRKKRTKIPSPPSMVEDKGNQKINLKFCFDDDESDSANSSPNDISGVSSPSTAPPIGRPTKTKRMTIVDLCTP